MHVSVLSVWKSRSTSQNEDQEPKQINIQLIFATMRKPTTHFKLMEQPIDVRNLDTRVEIDLLLSKYQVILCVVGSKFFVE